MPTACITGRAAAAVLACLLLLDAAAGAAGRQPPPFRPAPAADARGFIDVWALRRDVIAVESLVPTTDGERCEPDGDSDEEPSPEQVEASREAARSCLQAAGREERRYAEARAAFNRAWLPVLQRAIAAGDPVAEVVFRLCETTDVIDRGRARSTCHPQPAEAEAALERLREIGFEPAATPCDPSVWIWQRAFRFCHARHPIWATDGFSALRLNRRPETPGFMTWGPQLHFGGGAEPYSGLNQRDPTDLALEMNEREIDRLMRAEPRWAVFLLHRVGRHEWVPEGTRSTTARLDPSWAGRWRLERSFADWSRPGAPASGSAEIRRAGEGTTITIESGAGAPQADVVDCPLRYSGGLTYLPQRDARGRQLAERTSLGYFSTYVKAGTFGPPDQVDEALAPLDPAKRYRQVLMLCEGGEHVRNERVRFLLLAGDVLVEVAAESPDGARPLAVRHFRRVR